MIPSDMWFIYLMMMPMILIIIMIIKIMGIVAQRLGARLGVRWPPITRVRIPTKSFLAGNGIHMPYPKESFKRILSPREKVSNANVIPKIIIIMIIVLIFLPMKIMVMLIVNMSSDNYEIKTFIFLIILIMISMKVFIMVTIVMVLVAIIIIEN